MSSMAVDTPATSSAAPSNAGALAAASSNAQRAYSRGAIDIHGIPRRRVWTVLGADIPAGTNIVTTANPVDWLPGDLVVITSSDYDFEHAEEADILAVLSPTRFTVNITFRWDHLGTIVPGASVSWDSDLDMRAEVGLLTRNIIIQGDDNSDAQLFGVHTGVFMGGIFHVENAEIRRCGQAFLMGRYCTHMVRRELHCSWSTSTPPVPFTFQSHFTLQHEAGVEDDSYIRFNSIHHSYQRAVTIHDTDKTTVRHNFAYKIHVR